MTKQLHNIALDEGVQRDEQPGRGAQLATLGALAADGTAVEQLLADPPNVRLSRGYLRPDTYTRPDMIADELRELSGSALGAVPLFRPGESYQDAGYYEVEAATVEPIHAAERGVYRYDLQLESAGSRGQSLRTVAINPSTESHPFGSGSGASVAVPDSARAVRWRDPGAQTTSAATDDGTVGSAQGTLREYALADAPSDATELLYDVPYSDDPVGCRVYDSRGNGDKLDANGIRCWQTVTDTTHDPTPDAPVILSNGRTRLRVDLPAAGNTGTLETADWSGSWGSWSDITPTDYDPVEVDLIEIDQQRVEAQLLFASSTGSNVYAVNIALTLGYGDPLIYAAPSESTSIPSNIQSALSGAARDSEERTRATRTLRARDEVRR